MKTYSITYDLGNPTRDYEGVAAAIKSIANGFCRPTQSQWIVNSAQSAAQIRDVVGRKIDSDDKLFVTEVGDLWASRGLPKSTSEWLSAHWHSSCKVS